jgi:hypothetical protein
MADDSDNEGGKKTGKSRRELPAGAVATLKAWLLSPEHFTHPYPTPQDQIMLMQKTGIDKKQLKNWFTNARRRIWKPMLKKQLEQGKIQQSGVGGVVTLNTTGAPGMMPPAAGTDYAAPHGQVPDMQQNYQIQQPPQQQYDQYGQPISYVQQPPQQSQQYGAQSSYYGQTQAPMQQYNQSEMHPASSSTNLNKTDSHAVLMELFARDQDLVRKQASRERGQDGNQNPEVMNGHNGTASQHPMGNKVAGGTSTFNKNGSVTSMNSWPHFSSVSSLNNLGTMTGVKSITNMSAADLANQGTLNNKGNLAQVKSIENMGRADSYAFLEVFFENPSSNNLQGMSGATGGSMRGIKREREEEDNIGLSLDGEDTASPAGVSAPSTLTSAVGAPVPAPLPANEEKEGLKRAYDDALAARGLISVSRSSENLTELPKKFQRTISQDYLKSMANGGNGTTFTTFSFSAPPPSAEKPVENPISEEKETVQVAANAVCGICREKNVDTQIKPCGCLFHGTCFRKSSLEGGRSPTCPFCSSMVTSAILCVPQE